MLVYVGYYKLLIFKIVVKVYIIKLFFSFSHNKGIKSKYFSNLNKLIKNELSL